MCICLYSTGTYRCRQKIGNERVNAIGKSVVQAAVFLDYGDVTDLLVLSMIFDE